MKQRLLSGGDDRGQILIMTALSLVAVLGVAALSLDASYMYDKRNRLHAAADGAAKSAAIEYARNETGISLADMQRFADQQVAAHGFVPQRMSGSTTVDVYWPCPRSAIAWYNCNQHYVEVVVSEPTSTFFARVLGWTGMTPGARALAGDVPSSNCIITFTAFTMGNNNNVNMPNCGIEDGGTMSLGNNTVINAAYVGVSDSSCSGGGCGNVSNLNLNAPQPADPLPLVPTPTDPGGPACTAPLTIAANTTLSAQKYCGWKFDGGDLTLNSGIYYITGPITARTPGKPVHITGSDVLIYLAPGASIDLDSNDVVLNLSGRTGGPWRGILFFQDRSNANDANLAKNNGDLTLSGALYFPAADLTVKNNLTTGFGSDCTLLVANSLTLKNNGDIESTCSAFGGYGSPFRSVTLAE